MRRQHAILGSMETRVSRYGRRRPRAAGTPAKRRWPFIAAGLVLASFTVINLIVRNTSLGTYLPALFGLPVALYGFFRPRLDAWFSHGAGRAVMWAAVILYAAAAIVVGAGSIAIAGALMHSPPRNADAVIVLGAAVHGDEVTDTLRKRLDTAIEYYLENPETCIVVSGGMGSGENVSEAEAMRRYLEAHGVPGDAILTEDQAANTRENFRFSKNLLDQAFGRPVQIVYVTSDFHVLRAGAEARMAGFEDAHGLGAPTPFFTVPGAWLRESGALVRGFARGDFSG